MTLIVGVDYGPETLILADTRVSYRDSPQSPQSRDRLRKIITIGFSGRSAVLGFSGDVREIQRFLRHVKRKAQSSTCSGNLVDDLKRWMEEPVRPSSSLSFMLCDFDPFGSSHLNVYELTTNGEVRSRPDRVFNVPGARIAVIGSGSRFKDHIRKAALTSIGSPKAYKDYEAYSRLRAMWTEMIIHTYVQDLALRDIGGPFAMVRVRPDEVIGPHFLLPYGEDSSDWQVTEDGKKTILHNPSTNRRYTLYSIFAHMDADFYAREDAFAASA